MKKQFHTSKGIIERELTQMEIETFAAMGELDCKKELAKQKIKSAKSLDERILIIEELLDIK